MTVGEVLGSVTVPGLPDEVKTARRFVAKLLGDRCPQLDSVILLTSEAVTNGILHSDSGKGGSITIAVVRMPDAIRVEVTDDGGGGAPAVGMDGGLREHGHGLLLVQELAARHGHHLGAVDRLTFWFEVHC